MDEQTLSLIPATEEDLQYLNPEPQSPGLVPATEEDLQYITPEIREPTMQEMTSDFETFKMFRKAGAFDSGKTATEMVTEGVSGMASDLGHWAKTLPMRLASNFLFLDKVSDTYKPLGKVKTKAKATTLQTIGNLELDYKSIGAGISRGVDKVFSDAETEEDLRSSYEFFKTQADLEQQRQGKAAEMVTEGFLGMSPEFLTLGMSEEERQVIRSQQVTPDMKAARGGSLPSDPTNFIPMGAAFKMATGTGRATLKGAEKVLINETLQLAKLQDDMTKALSRVGDNSIKSRRLAIKQAPVKARLEKGLTEVTEKIAENKAKLKPLAAKRDMALTQLASDLPVGNPLKDFLNDALKEVPIKQPLNLTNKVGGAGLILVGKPMEYLGNALQFIKTLPQETAINMLIKAGDKVGMEVTEGNAKLLIKSGVAGGVFAGGYSLAGEFTDSELGKLGGAVGALLGPQFLARFGRNTAILGRETMNPASDLPFFTRLASKDAEKMTTQLIDRTALVPVESVARQVTGAAEGKVLSRMGGPQAFGNMSPGGQATVNFLDRSGLGRYVESTGRMAKGVGAGGAVGGAFGLAASGGMDMPEAFYGGIGAGMLFGSAGAVGGEVARFNGPINHMEARYGDLYHYAENYLPAGQKESFNKLNRDVQMAVANKIVANPSLAIEYVSNGKDGEGGYFDRVTGDIVINVDSPRAIEPLLAHEFTHYLEQTGGKRKFIDLLIGNPVIGKPGIFVQRVTQQNKSRYPDLKVGDPIMVGEGANRRFLLSMEFEQARSEYGKKLQDTLLDSDGNKMSDSDLAKIMTDEQTVSEIVAEHGTDFLLNDKRKYRDKNKGTIGKIMGSMLDTELVQNIPALRKTLAMMGGTFRPDGQLITDNKLFSNLKRYPQITELVRKYNNQLEGMSPQKRQAQEASGEIQGGNIKSGGKATKEVVVDIKSAELAKSPQLAELLRSGTLLQIDKDGNVIPNLAMTAREQGKYNRSFAEKMKEAIEEKEANEGLPEGHVRPEVNPKTGKIRFVGRYLDDSVIDKLEKSGNWNKEQIQTLRDVNSNIRNNGGNEYLISYFKAAGQGGGKYVNAKVENHIEVPYGFEITQKNNIILRTVSVNQLVKNVDQLARQQQAELTRLYGADIAQAKVKLLQDLDRYHRNHADGQPGRTGLDADQNIAKAKADFINSAFGSGTKAEASSNPWRASLGKKNPRDVYRSRRIERIGKMDQLSGTRFIDYDKINKAFMPTETFEGSPGSYFRPKSSRDTSAQVRTFKSPVQLKDGSRLSGVADNPEQSPFYGFDKNGQEFSQGREYINPQDITKSRDSDRTANQIRNELETGQKLFIPAYHGTPHTLAPEAGAPLGRFRTSKIGTGEGAQAYGHGLYFAGKREVAEHYRNALGYDPDKMKINGRQINDEYNRFAGNPKATNLDYQIAEGIERLMMNESPQDVISYFKENDFDPKAIEYIKDAKFETYGSLYKVELAPKENEYLLWDKPLSKQPKGVREKIENMNIKVPDGFSDPTGNDIYNYANTDKYAFGSDADVLSSAALKEAGIPGIKYLDGASRSKGEGDYNYVIFDEADVTVTEKLFMPASEAGAPRNIKNYRNSLWDEVKKGNYFKEDPLGPALYRSMSKSEWESLQKKGELKPVTGEKGIFVTRDVDRLVGGAYGGKTEGGVIAKIDDTKTKPLKSRYANFEEDSIPSLKLKSVSEVWDSKSGENIFSRNPEKLFMPASEAGAGKGKVAEAAKLWKEKGIDSPYFKKWFGKSKVVDDNGEPLVVYHGTDKQFTSFDPEKSIGGQHWFTSDKSAIESGEVGAQGKGIIMETYLNIKKPAGWAEYDKFTIDELLGRGYDGLILPESDGTATYVAYSPEQIKSATGNRGTFDAGERNILFMPASEAKNPKSGDMLTLDDSSLKLFLPSPSNPNASLSEFKGKNVQVLTADLSVVGDKKADGAIISFTGGPGYLSVNDAWGFTNEAGAKAFKTRWERDGKPLIGITSMKQENHRASTLTREYYVRKFMEAINDGKISENTVNRHIKTALKRAIDGKNGLTNNQKAALKTVKTIEDFLKVFPDKELIPWKATPMIYGKLDAKTLPIKQDRLKKLGLDTDTILRETRQPEYNDIKKGSLLAIAEYDGSGATYRPDLNSAYPWSIPLNEKAFLKDFADIQDLSSRQDLRGSDGEANMAVAMGAGVVLDKLSRGDVNFMPSDPKAPKAQPANRIQQQAPAMPGNRFMAPAASAGSKLSERFR